MSIHTIHQNPQKFDLTQIRADFRAAGKKFDLEEMARIREKVANVAKSVFTSEEEKGEYSKFLEEIDIEIVCYRVSDENFKRLKNTPPEPEYEPPEILVNILVYPVAYLLMALEFVIRPDRSFSVADQYRAIEIGREELDRQMYDRNDDEDD